MFLGRYSKLSTIKPFLVLVGITILSYVFLLAVRADSLRLGKILGQWMWYFYPRDVSGKLWFPYTVFLITLASFFLAKILLDGQRLNRLSELLLIFALVLVVFALNMSVFSLSMFGLDELPQIVIHSGRTSFFTDAVKIQNVGLFLQQYSENIKSLTHHSQVHGPGPILLFWSVYQALGGIDVSDSALAYLNHFLRLDLGYLKNLLISSGMPGDTAAILTSLFMGLFFPFAASLTILPLYYLGKMIYGKTVALFACGVFATMPAIFLFTPQLAQMLTLLGVLVTWLFFKSLKDNSTPLAMVAGLTFGISLFFSLELLTLVPIWIAAALFSKRMCSKGKVASTISMQMKTRELQKIVLAFFSAVFLFFVVLFILFKFNVLEAYRNSMAIHDVLEVRRPYSKWIWANFVEYFVFMGIPFTFLFLRRFIGQFKVSDLQGVDFFMLSFVLTLLALDFSGINRGEVARLWMFLAPFVALFVGSEIKSLGSLMRPGLFMYAVFLVILSLEFSYAVNLKFTLLTLPLRMF